MGEIITTGMKTGLLIGGISMNFEYNHYYTKLYEMPLMTIVVAAIMFLSCTAILTVYLSKSRRMTVYKFGLFLASIFSIILLISGATSIKLDIKSDNPSESIQLLGEITEINPISNPPRFYYQGEIVIPKIIVINETEYYCMTVGSIQIGDYVEIQYLENSKVVMSIHETE